MHSLKSKIHFIFWFQVNWRNMLTMLLVVLKRFHHGLGQL